MSRSFCVAEWFRRHCPSQPELELAKLRKDRTGQACRGTVLANEEVEEWKAKGHGRGEAADPNFELATPQPEGHFISEGSPQTPAGE